jgi:hypothetical protein
MTGNNDTLQVRNRSAKTITGGTSESLDTLILTGKEVKCMPSA